MKPRSTIGAVSLLVFACLLGSSDVFAQSRGNATVEDRKTILRDALELSSTGRFEDVIILLEPYIDEHPGDVDVWIMLARHRYWTDDRTGALGDFEQAIRLHPNHGDLRLAFAEFLSETGRLRAAARVIRPVERDDSETHALKGRIAWWRGDLTSAKDHFEQVVRLGAGNVEASTALDAINAASRPWLDVRVGAADDTQPLANYETGLRAGIYLNPLHTFAVVPVWARYDAGPSSEAVAGGELEYGGYWPTVRTELRLAAGGRSHLDTLRFTGRAEAATRIAGGITTSLLVERAPYFHTVTSIGQSILTTTAGAAVTLDRPGWLGEAAVRREVYPDENRKQVAFAWLMRTLVETDVVKLDAGYAYSFEDSDESRFFPVLSSAPRPGRPPGWTGRYLPYYTPLNYRTHSATATVTLRPHERVTLGGGGTFTFLGHEDAPYVYSVGPAPATGVYRHEIQPWEVRASLTVDLSRSASASIRVSHLSKTWYEATNVGLSFNVRL